MKMDRLLAITTYLLNHETVSATALARRFEVSRRTIQLDIDTLSVAGIPVMATHGAGGGYRILDGFKLQKQIAGEEDYLHIAMALKGLASAYDSDPVAGTLDKMLSMAPSLRQSVFVDLSVAKENAAINRRLRQLDAAIRSRTPVSIGYTDSQSRPTTRVVEPLALSYRWYAWYLFAYCTQKQEYRLFKLPRITACEPQEGTFTKDHGDVEALMSTHGGDQGDPWQVRLLCRAKARSQVLEYLRGDIIEEHPNGDFVLAFCLPYERMWFSLLLGFGEQVQVLQPEELRAMVLQKARKILNTYEMVTQ